MDTPFHMPSYYRRRQERPLLEHATELIQRFESERRDADRRLWTEEVKKRQECDRAWILQNFQVFYDFYDLPLLGYVAMLLEKNLLDYLDIATLEEIRSNLRDDSARFSKAEIRTWFDDYIYEVQTDRIIDLSHDGYRDKPSITVFDLHHVSDEVTLVSYRNKKRLCRIYLVGDGDNAGLFEVIDSYGRLARESGFIFVQ